MEDFTPQARQTPPVAFPTLRRTARVSVRNSVLTEDGDLSSYATPSVIKRSVG